MESAERLAFGPDVFARIHLRGRSPCPYHSAPFVVFLYTAPIFTALGLQFLPEERLSRLQWAGIAIAFMGIVIAFFGFSNRPALELIIGDLLRCSEE